MSFSRIARLRPAVSPRVCPSVRASLQWRAASSHGSSPASAATKEVKPLVQKGLNPKEQAFDQEFVIPGAEGDRGIERVEREARSKLRRVARHQGDFSSVEERHILFGARGTLDKPVKVESVYPSRIVGCFGSEETHQHDLLWHVVKRERPTVCLECGQVFQLVLPPGEHAQSRHHEHHDHH